MALATINQNFEKIGKVELFLAEYPVAGYTGATLTDKIENVYELFYSDGTARKALKAGTYVWGNINEGGVALKFKGNTVENDTMLGSKHPVGYSSFSAELEGSINDVDANHMKDIISALSGSVLTTTAATGIAGRTTIMIGGQQALKKYALLLRSVNPSITGEFDNYLFPRVVMDLDSDLKFEKGKVLELKFKITALYDQTFLDPDTGLPAIGFMDTVTAAAS